LWDALEGKYNASVNKNNNSERISPRLARRWGQLNEVLMAEHKATAAAMTLVGKSSDVWTIFHEGLSRDEAAELMSVLREGSGEPGKPPTKTELVKQLEILFQLYADDVDCADLTPASKAHYIDFANCFVRWIRGEFEPGRNAGKRRLPANWKERTDTTPKLPAPGDEV
jgi:hypothetical protein